MERYIYGRNPVLEALQQNVPVKQVLISDSVKNRDLFIRDIKKAGKGVNIKLVDRKVIDQIAGKDARSGGVCAELGKLTVFGSDGPFLKAVQAGKEKPLIAAVDSVHDPRNFGAIIRSAAAAGFSGIMFPKDRQSGITGVTVSASAGTCFRINLFQAVNLARELENLKKAGFWIYGTDMNEDMTVYNAEFAEPLVIVFGSEGKGLRPLVKKTCDQIVSIPLIGSVESLNVSVAAGITMYEILRKLGRIGSK